MKSPVRQVILGSRGSQLALWQTEFVKSELERHFPALTIGIEIIKTTGDKILDSALSRIGDKGLFTKEIEHALLDRRIDLAVHSMKDLPTELPSGLMIGAVTKREDVRDVFIAHPSKKYASLADVPQKGIIATGSLRRKCQIKHLRPDLGIVDLRGNLNTRFTKLENSDWDGIILARAGVVRLGFEQKITETLPLDKMLPAVGQGALAIEIRDAEPKVKSLLEPLTSRSASIATAAERAFLHFLEGGCQVPIGSYAVIKDNTLTLEGLIGTLDGERLIRGKIQGDPAEASRLGEELGRTLYNSGGREILASIRTAAPGIAPVMV